MTAKRLSERGERARAAQAVGPRHGQGPEAVGRRPATTVPVVPLWERLGGGARG
ncbi:hypothetical protein [Streptomyces sp. NPDC003635]